MAIKFERPSILFGVYRSDLMRAEADSNLARMLTELDQRIVRIQVSQTDFDVPALLANYPNRENTVFFVRNLRWGENEGREAYRALNIRREYTVFSKIKSSRGILTTRAERGKDTTPTKPQYSPSAP